MASTSTYMKMKGYSKIQLMSSNRSKSTDFTYQTIKTPRIQKPISPTQDQTKPLDDDYDYNHYSGNNNQEQQDETFSKETMRIINRSATSHGTTTDANSKSSTNSRSKIEKQNSTGRTLNTAVKRVLSIRRSSSVSESYARIHDQCSDYSFDVEEDDEVLQMARSKNTMKKRSSGSMLKACKRIFGL